MFVITALYWVLRRYARTGTAVLVAAAVGTYWFAFLHMPGNPVAALAMSLIQILPMTYLWLRRGLETAIGFHVGLDLVRFLAAYLAAQHLWFS